MFKEHSEIWPEKYVDLRISCVSSSAEVQVRRTYDGRDNRKNRAEIVVRVWFNDTGGYLIVLEATNCAGDKDVKPRREEDGEYER